MSTNDQGFGKAEIGFIEKEAKIIKYRLSNFGEDEINSIVKGFGIRFTKLIFFFFN